MGTSANFVPIKSKSTDLNLSSLHHSFASFPSLKCCFFLILFFSSQSSNFFEAHGRYRNLNPVSTVTALIRWKHNNLNWVFSSSSPFAALKIFEISVTIWHLYYGYASVNNKREVHINCWLNLDSNRVHTNNQVMFMFYLQCKFGTFQKFN